MYNSHYQNYLLSFALVCFCTAVTPSNILVVSPVPSDSHFKISEAITVGLANVGHTVTIVSAYDYKPQNMSKVQSIQVTGAVQWAEEFKAKDLGAFEKSPVDTMVSMLFSGGWDLCNLTLTDPAVRALFNHTYDLVIVDIFGTESLIVLGQIFNAPVVGFSAYSTAKWTNLLPVSYKLNFSNRVASLFHRIHYSIFHMYESITLAYLHHPLQVPNVIEIGGIHVEWNGFKRPERPLSQDIKQFIDTATDGVVYLSFGSISKGKELPTNKRDTFINTFAKHKQKFIWKFSEPTVKMPENVLAKSWFPQADILGHMNVKAFISDGDLLDCIEAVYHGVPILGIPLFIDQIRNVKRASETGWAVTLDYSNITAISVEWALNEILQDKYLEKAQSVSKHYRDQPMTPMNTMVYWSEYVIRHRGAPHLRAPRIDLNYIQYHNVDVFVAIFCFIMLYVYAVKWTMHKVFWQKSRLRVKVERKEQ
ncbi:UDP-glucosyltransferase 2-like isoform X2 [Bradysia coprophila]|uniref:UDP-glucosyltransferase 2-like isoform X2 n=1 Tax=Bradysia coprophila TaxID=38358 RepID=UPI00187DC660|nr:UDP-glucosyltransferase 2-like isoform X2 [Bradysia coprophila]